MPSERRYDAATIATGVKLDKRGFIELGAFVTRTGVLSYRRADGSIVRELRHPDDVFRAASLDTLRGAPITVDHPGHGQTWVTPENAAEHEVGVVSAGAVHENKYVDARLSVRRADAIRRVNSRELVECSAAYDCDTVVEKGTFEGQAYDQRQTNIVYNHIAMLPPGKGRAGSDVRMRADSTDAVLVVDDAQQQPKGPATLPRVPQEEPPMSTRKLRVDGVEYELPETAASVFEKVVTERESNKKRADTAESERDVMKTALDKAKDPKTVASLVQGRVTLERQAGKVFGADKRFDGKTDREVQEEVLAKLQPEYKREGRSDDAISAAFDFAVANTKGKNLGLQVVRGAITESERQAGGSDGSEADGEQKFRRADGTEVSVDAQLDALEQKRQKAWTGGK